ncbi:hypothetical protein BVX98_04745 [bacterium F11]|nr:hypothetical protein BVX98_04745 [bacterium F11]
MKFNIYILLGFLLGMTGCAHNGPVTLNKDYDFSKVKRVAVMGFESMGGVEESGPSFTSIFEKLLLRAGYQMVEREKVARVIDEQNFQFSGAVNPRQVIEIGRILGVEALVLGHVTVYSPHEKGIVLVEVHSEEKEPIISKKRIETVRNKETIIEEYDVVTDYRITNQTRQIPQVYRIQAEAGVVVKMVDSQSGEIAWVGSATDEAVNVQTAAEFVSHRIIQSLKKIWPSKLAKDL